MLHYCFSSRASINQTCDRRDGRAEQEGFVSFHKRDVNAERIPKSFHRLDAGGDWVFRLSARRAWGSLATGEAEIVLFPAERMTCFAAVMAAPIAKPAELEVAMPVMVSNPSRLAVSQPVPAAYPSKLAVSQPVPAAYLAKLLLEVAASDQIRWLWDVLVLAFVPAAREWTAWAHSEITAA